MKVLHFTHCYIPVYGGTTTRLINMFSRDGNDHTMVIPHAGTQYVPKQIAELNDRDRYDNVSVVRVRLSRFRDVDLPVLEYLVKVNNWKRNSRELTGSVSGSGYDLIFGHNPSEFALAAARYSSAKNIPYFYEVHGLIKDTLYTSPNRFKRLYNAFGNGIVERMERDILDKAAFVIVQTSMIKERLIREYAIRPEKIAVIYNGVDLDTFDPRKYADGAASFRREKGYDDKVVFSYFGFLDDNNGIRFLLDSIERLPDRCRKRIVFLVVGRGPYAELVRDFSVRNTCVQFLGLAEYGKMPLYYAATDVYVIPRPKNPATDNIVPMKLFEAMAMENIILVSDVGGLTEAVRDGETGIVYRPGDEKDFQAKIDELSGNADAFRSLGKNAARDVREKYSWTRGREILAGLYGTVSGRSRTVSK